MLCSILQLVLASNPYRALHILCSLMKVLLSQLELLDNQAKASTKDVPVASASEEADF